MKEIMYIGLPETFEECAMKGYSNSLEFVAYRQRMMSRKKNVGDLRYISDNHYGIGMKRYFIKYQIPICKQSRKTPNLLDKS